MSREITQRELRNRSGEIMRALDEGEVFIVTRNGVPVGELAPLRRHRFIAAEATLAKFRAAPSVDHDRLRADPWMPSPYRTRCLVAERQRRPRGVLDTSALIALEELDVARLPVEIAVSAITMAELAAGPHATNDPDERGRRQDRLQRAEAAFDPLPFDGGAARAYGRIHASVVASGRKGRGARAADLLIAANALPAGLPLYTRNGDDFQALDGLADVIVV